MATSVSIKGKTQANDGVTSTINYVNPNATDSQLVSLATAMNNLTTNTVTDITRIEKNSLLNTVEKLPRNAFFSLSGESTPVTSISASDISTTLNNPTMLDIHYNEQSDVTDWDISITIDSASQTHQTCYFYSWSGRLPSIDTGTLFILKILDGHTETITMTIAENATYQAATITLTITAE